MEVKEYLGILIDYSRDRIIPERGLALLTGKGFYKKDHETSPQETFARAATCYSFGDHEFAQRIYDYASKGYFTFASPVLSNAIEVNWPDFKEDEFTEAGEWLQDNNEPDGLPISCYLNYIGDKKESLVATREETAWLSMMGGGIGVYAGNRSPDEKSTGVMAHLRGYDADTLAYRQTSSRRGSMAAYLDIDHPEILSFLEMRDPVGGDQNKKCFNLNNAVNITDSFMEAVISGGKYELIDPKHGHTGRFLEARHVYEKILKMRFETGEPYIMFKDTVNRNIPTWIKHPLYRVVQSNLCVVPETKILTDKGQVKIADLEDKEVSVWNGEEFSKTVVRRTSDDSKIIKVITSSGQELECTEYHKFYTKNSHGKPEEMVRAKDLKVGDKLIKFDLPVIQGERGLDKAYQNGFYSGDGCEVQGKSRIYLYHDKRELLHKFDLKGQYDQCVQKRIYGYEEGLQSKYFVPTSEYTVDSRLQWLAGYCDADGTIINTEGNEALQVASINKGFLKEIQLMLQTLGVTSKVTKNRDKGEYLLPANDGTGELKKFGCKELNRLLVSSSGLHKLHLLGFTCERLKFSGRKPNRNAEQFIRVVDVVDEGRYSETYCFTEGKRGMGMFNGILTGQCSEITLMTSLKRTAVCCLSSLNLARYDSWKGTSIVRDLIRLLDNVLEYFILMAPPTLKRAIRSAQKERAVGLGTLGFHSYLQSKSIAFESGGMGSAAQITNKIYKYIKDEAVKESLRLGSIRGEAPDTTGSGMRNSHLLAIAPNASSSNLVGKYDTSPSIEPSAAVCYNAQGRSGNHLIKNEYFEEVLEKYGKNTLDIWKSIANHQGSVQHLDFLTDHEKRVFKTANEINPQWIIELAAIRQQFICQAQSVNIFMSADTTMQEMSDLHMLAWKKGLKTLYYCRAEPSSKIVLGTGGDRPLNSIPVRNKIEYEECLSCSG